MKATFVFFIICCISNDKVYSRHVSNHHIDGNSSFLLELLHSLSFQSMIIEIVYNSCILGMVES
jgi:hypothetical protein